ncbi:hypothetical protein L6452_25422 [Arctium lappa]|uniref:Uncharacterized protein n=1 Tax=Arctium lappa TaxID=4217 RepID=A0ACB9AFE3_ARCLA|nr:hypothetical protein L6452_25422 [Arctium lappa]
MSSFNNTIGLSWRDNDRLGLIGERWDRLLTTNTQKGDGRHATQFHNPRIPNCLSLFFIPATFTSTYPDKIIV